MKGEGADRRGLIDRGFRGDQRSLFLQNNENDFIKSNDNRNFSVGRSCQEQPAGLK